MYVKAFTYLGPGRRMADCLNGLCSDDLVHEIAVASREAERMRLSLGVASARTYAPRVPREFNRDVLIVQANYIRLKYGL